MAVVKVKYTGKRSGHAAVTVPGFGYFKPGTEVELEEKEAARWIAPAEDGLSDWELATSESQKAADGAQPKGGKG